MSLSSVAASRPPAGRSEVSEAVLEQVVRALEVGAQALLRGRSLPAGQGALAGRDEELPVDADEQARRHPRVELVDAELVLDRVAEDAREVGHDLELLGPERRPSFDDP